MDVHFESAPSLFPTRSLPSCLVPRTNDSNGDTRQYHAIGFGAVVNKDAAGYVHHLVLQAFTVDNCDRLCDKDHSTTPSSYSASSSALCDDIIFAVIFAWAPEAPGIGLPSDVGLLLGIASGRFISPYYQIHHNNPGRVEGLVDDSGDRVHYTEELRLKNMGVIELHDPFNEHLGKPVPEGKFLLLLPLPELLIRGGSIFEVRKESRFVCYERILSIVFAVWPQYRSFERFHGL